MANKTRLPKQEMRQWIRGRMNWTHEEWLELLDDLRGQGFGVYTDTPEGQEELGAYLEENRGYGLKDTFPEKELDGWLKGRDTWSHGEWLQLLDGLRADGYGKFTDTDEGRARIGAYLEQQQ